MTQVLQTSSLVADNLNFGIYNMNFYVHSPFNFQLSVSSTLLETLQEKQSVQMAQQGGFIIHAFLRQLYLRNDFLDPTFDPEFCQLACPPFYARLRCFDQLGKACL